MSAATSSNPTADAAGVAHAADATPGGVAVSGGPVADGPVAEGPVADGPVASRGADPSACVIRRSELAELIAALAVHPAADAAAGAAGSGGAGRAAARYPAALRAEAFDVAARVADPDERATLAGQVGALGAARLLSALVGAAVPGATRDPAADALLAALRGAAGPAAATAGPDDRARDAEADERLCAMHRASRYTETPPLGIPAGIELWPVRLLPPAPVGKLFGRGLPPGTAPRLVFGDRGQVNREPTLDWPQWYRLGIWHATLVGRWAGAVAAASAAGFALDAAFADLPAVALRKVTAHESTVSTFRTWSSYFLDGLVSAAKVVLEEGVTGPAGGEDQMRWLRSLGRVHLPWFVAAVRDAGVDRLDPAELARAWLADAPGLAELRPAFHGPLAACENPLWAVRPRVLFSPAVDRLTRRSLAAWLRTQWPGGVEIVDDPDPAAPPEPGGRLVFAVAADTSWLDALGVDVAPADRTRWARLCGATSQPAVVGADATGGESTDPPYEARGLLYAYRHPGPGGDPTTGDVWSRACIAATGQDVTRLQQARRPFSDWTALGADGSTSSGRLDQEPDGRLRFRGDGPR